MNHKKLAPLSIALAALDPHLERLSAAGEAAHLVRKREGGRAGGWWREKNIEEVFATLGILLLEFPLATKILFRLNFNGA